MTTKNDNRMLWIRTEDKITKEGISYSFEYEIASELRITGILDYNNYIKCGLYSIEKDENGNFFIAQEGELIVFEETGKLVIKYMLKLYEYHTKNN